MAKDKSQILYMSSGPPVSMENIVILGNIITAAKTIDDIIP